MPITEVRVRMYPRDRKSRVLAFVSITVEGIALHDFRVLESAEGPIIVNPDRPIVAPCISRDCGCRNPLKAKYCNECGSPLKPIDVMLGHSGFPRKQFMDVTHAIDPYTRDQLYSLMLLAYETETEIWDGNASRDPSVYEVTQQRSILLGQPWQLRRVAIAA